MYFAKLGSCWYTYDTREKLLDDMVGFKQPTARVMWAVPLPVEEKTALQNDVRMLLEEQEQRAEVSYALRAKACELVDTLREYEQANKLLVRVGRDQLDASGTDAELTGVLSELWRVLKRDDVCLLADTEADWQARWREAPEVMIDVAQRALHR
jgi:hypothetical protein